MSTTPTAADWGGTAHYADLRGPVHYVDFGGPVDGPTFVLVHGLGGSHLNWCLLAQRLIPHGRVVALDLAGFGLTNPDGRATTVRANTALLDRFLADIIGEPVILVGNSMGGAIAILQAANRPDSVSKLVLIAPALPIAIGALPDPLVTVTFAGYALPMIGEWFLATSRARLSPHEQAKRVYDLCCADPSVIPAALAAASVALLEQRAAVPGLDAAFLAAARSAVRLAARRRTYRARMRAVRAPVLLIHGELDRLVSIRNARATAARNPHWQFETFPAVGHVPQLEVPDLTAARILNWMAKLTTDRRAN
jgi:pimeloyl-ACP methyl ester carboxylesterase